MVKRYIVTKKRVTVVTPLYICNHHWLLEKRFFRDAIQNMEIGKYNEGEKDIDHVDTVKTAGELMVKNRYSGASFELKFVMAEDKKTMIHAKPWVTYGINPIYHDWLKRKGIQIYANGSEADHCEPYLLMKNGKQVGLVMPIKVNGGERKEKSNSVRYLESI